MATRKRRQLTAVGLLAVSAMALTGCLQNPNESGAGAAGLDGYVDNAESDGDGVVTILGAFGGPEQEAFEASLKAFEDESGIDVQYVADQNFTTTVKQKVESGSAPDVGLFPQPGGLLELAADSYVQPIDTYLDYTTLNQTLIPGFLDAANLNGRIYGAPMRMAVKSIVWYPKKAWEAEGYPTEFKTIQELVDFSNKLIADGKTPWCQGWESDQATGWVGTDWVEEYVLRVAGPEVYDQWVAHDIPFNDPAIVEAVEAYAVIAKGEGMVLGGSKGILNTPFAEAMLPAFDSEPKCWMERQGNFVTGFYPEEVQANLDEEVGTFVFPPYDGGYAGQPVLGGGDIAALFNGNDDEAIEVMRFITSDEFGGEWAAAGGWLSPHRTFDGSLYPDETTRSVAELAAAADVFRYDGSDAMVKEVGSDSFWKGMVSWMSGASTEEMLTKIEEGWPEES